MFVNYYCHMSLINDLGHLKLLFRSLNLLPVFLFVICHLYLYIVRLVVPLTEQYHG